MPVNRPKAPVKAPVKAPAKAPVKAHPESRPKEPLVLYTERRDGPPEHGFLIVYAETRFIPCLRISMESKPRDNLCHSLLRMDFLVGWLERCALSRYPVKISFKQTRHQNWARFVFDQVLAKFPPGERILQLPPQIEMDFFRPLRDQGISNLKNRHLRDLAMLFLFEYWDRCLVGSEQLGQLEDLGIPLGKLDGDHISSRPHRLELKLEMKKSGL